MSEALKSICAFARSDMKAWCYYCQGALFRIYQFVFPEKSCQMEIVETHATGGKDCVFSTWYTDKEE